jgi:hypothetical protein
LRRTRVYWSYTLNEPSQGRIAVQLKLGSATPWCTDAPAKPSDSGKNDHVDKFTAQPKTPAPVSLPAGALSGACSPVAARDSAARAAAIRRRAGSR